MGYHWHRQKLSVILKKNLFHENLIKNCSQGWGKKQPHSCCQEASKFYFKILFIGPFLIIAQRRICKLANQLSYSIDKFNWLRLEKENTAKEHPVLASNIYLFPLSQMVLCACDHLGLLEHKLAVCLLVAYLAEHCLDQIVHQSLVIDL